MQEMGEHRVHPELKKLVVEASQALARLDAARLEELALSCQALNRDVKPTGAEGYTALALEARDAGGEMAVFARVLEATRSNLEVMNRLKELRTGRLDYRERPGQQWALTESGHGDN
jgi:aminopeptidase N